LERTPTTTISTISTQMNFISPLVPCRDKHIFPKTYLPPFRGQGGEGMIRDQRAIILSYLEDIVNN